MLQDQWNSAAIGIRPTKSAPCSPIKPITRTCSEPFHISYKVPVGDTPYVKAKSVQLVDKDPDRAIALFWVAINAGDRVDSALKDMAIVMKQQNRAEEAIEAIKSLRNRCSDQAQESLDNILLDLYKRCGRLDEQINLLKHKLHLIQQGLAFNGRRTKTARSQGRKFQVSVKQEATRLLGNLGWALMQQESYMEAEAAYRRALLIEPDNNKMCNLGICLMKQGRIAEAKETLKQVRPAKIDGPRGVDSHLKAFERAQEMLRDIELKTTGINGDRISQNWRFDAAFMATSSVWQPQPCLDFSKPREAFADENADVNRMNNRSAKLELFSGNSLSIDAPPYYSKIGKDTNQDHHILDSLSNLKRTRSNQDPEKPFIVPNQQQSEEPRNRRSLSCEENNEDKWMGLLPDNKAFDEAIVAAVLAPVMKAASGLMGDLYSKKSGPVGEKLVKRLRVFQDITQSLSPRA